MAKAALKPAPPPAKDAQAPAAEAKPVKTKKKPRGKLLWIVLIVRTIVGGATWWLFLGKTPTAEATPAAAPEKPPTFVNLDVFTVNLQPEVGDQYLQVSLSVKSLDPSVEEGMKLHMPDIRNRLLLLLSSKKASELLTVQGKVQLSSEILEEIRKPLPEEVRPHVAAVYFTSFVIQ